MPSCFLEYDTSSEIISRSYELQKSTSLQHGKNRIEEHYILLSLAQMHMKSDPSPHYGVVVARASRARSYYSSQPVAAPLHVAAAACKGVLWILRFEYDRCPHPVYKHVAHIYQSVPSARY